MRRRDLLLYASLLVAVAKCFLSLTTLSRHYSGDTVGYALAVKLGHPACLLDPYHPVLHPLARGACQLCRLAGWTVLYGAFVGYWVPGALSFWAPVLAAWWLLLAVVLPSLVPVILLSTWQLAALLLVTVVLPLESDPRRLARWPELLTTSGWRSQAVGIPLEGAVLLELAP